MLDVIIINIYIHYKADSVLRALQVLTHFNFTWPEVTSGSNRSCFSGDGLTPQKTEERMGEKSDSNEQQLSWGILSKKGKQKRHKGDVGQGRFVVFLCLGNTTH